MTANSRSIAVVTGASTGIGFELARCCAENGFDLIVAADEPAIETAAQAFKALGAAVEALEADLATPDGVDKRYRRAPGGGVASERRTRFGQRVSRSGFR